MEKSKLTKLIIKIKESNNDSLTGDVMNLTDALSAKIFGGNEPVGGNSTCWNSSCSNSSCSNSLNPLNNSCSNSACNTTRMTNNGCSNTGCTVSGE